MPTVPKTQTKTKIHKKRRSMTMATYFQSSLTCVGPGMGLVSSGGVQLLALLSCGAPDLHPQHCGSLGSSLPWQLLC